MAFADSITRATSEEQKVAIRAAYNGGYLKVYALAVAGTSEFSRSAEAKAIDKYSKLLNSRPEYHNVIEGHNPVMDDLSKVYGTVIMNSKRNVSNHKYEDKDRDMFVCQIVRDRASKRVQVIEGVKKGMFVSCDKKDRESFNYGDRVKIKAVEIISRGRPSLKAPNTAKLVRC